LITVRSEREAGCESVGGGGGGWGGGATVYRMILIRIAHL